MGVVDVDVYELVVEIEDVCFIGLVQIDFFGMFDGQRIYSIVGSLVEQGVMFIEIDYFLGVYFFIFEECGFCYNDGG